MAQQERAERAREEQDPDKIFTERSREAFHAQEREEQWRSDCKEKLGKWFDRIGMLPVPPHSAGELRRRVSRHVSRYADAAEYWMEITWQFGGYKFRAASTEDRESLLKVEICINGDWLKADTKAAIGHAILDEEQPRPRAVWGTEAGKPGPWAKGDVPPPPLDC